MEKRGWKPTPVELGQQVLCRRSGSGLSEDKQLHGGRGRDSFRGRETSQSVWELIPGLWPLFERKGSRRKEKEK